MKLIVMDLDEKEFPLVSTPSVSCSPDATQVYDATFTIEGRLPLGEGEELTGDVIWATDDSFPLRVFECSTFLRQEIRVHVPKIEVPEEEQENPVYDEMGNLIPVYMDDPNGKVTTTIMMTQTPYTPPPDPPEPPPPPTEEELLARAKEGRDTTLISMRDKCIAYGIDIYTEYGPEHFSLEERDKTMLLAIYAMVKGGLTSFPYHAIGASGRNSICTIYSDTDIARIAVAAFAFITFHESYCNMMIQWLDRAETVEEAEQIVYGANLPDDLQSYLEMVMMTAIADAGDSFPLALNMPQNGSMIQIPGPDFVPPVYPPEPPTPVVPETPEEPKNPETPETPDTPVEGGEETGGNESGEETGGEQTGGEDTGDAGAIAGPETNPEPEPEVPAEDPVETVDPVEGGGEGAEEIPPERADTPADEVAAPKTEETQTDSSPDDHE